MLEKHICIDPFTGTSGPAFLKGAEVHPDGVSPTDDELAAVLAAPALHTFASM